MSFSFGAMIGGLIVLILLLINLAVVNFQSENICEKHGMESTLQSTLKPFQVKAVVCKLDCNYEGCQVKYFKFTK